MSAPPPHVYPEHRRIRIGQTKENAPVTIRYFARDNKGRGNQGSYGRSYVGLTDTIYKAEDIKYDARYDEIKAPKARRDQIKSDWLRNFTTLDDPKKRPIDSVSDASTSAVPAKKVRIVKFEDVLEAFSNAETLSSRTLKKLAKHLRSTHELKKTPSVELLREM